MGCFANDLLRIPELALINSKITACGSINQSSKNKPYILLPAFWWKFFKISTKQIEHVSTLIKEIYSIKNRCFLYLKETHPNENHPFIEQIKYPSLPIFKRKIQV